MAVNYNERKFERVQRKIIYTNRDTLYYILTIVIAHNRRKLKKSLRTYKNTNEVRSAEFRTLDSRSKSRLVTLWQMWDVAKENARRQAYYLYQSLT